MAKSKETSEVTYIVVAEFRDLYNFNLIHKVGEDVSYFNQERLNGLVETGVVKLKSSLNDEK
jgi:hypothetical protein